MTFFEPRTPWFVLVAVSHGNERVIRHRSGLLSLDEELGNASIVRQRMGLSMDIVYRYTSVVESVSFELLIKTSRRKPNLKRRSRRC